MNGHHEGLELVCFSPDGTKVVSGSVDTTIKIWDVATGSCIATLIGHTSDVESVTFSPDGSKLLSGSNDGTIKIWNISTGQCIATFDNYKYKTVWSVDFSPDGTKIVSGSRNEAIKVWDVSTGQCIITIFAGGNIHIRGVWSVKFSLDGTKIVSGSHDNPLQIWDVSGLYVLNILSLEHLLVIIIAQQHSIFENTHLMVIYNSLPTEITNLMSTFHLEGVQKLGNNNLIAEDSPDGK